jgi:predicted DNA-binding protein (MmcQ/YjbR family)
MPPLAMAEAPRKLNKAKTQMDYDHAFKRRDWSKAWMKRFAAACAFPGVVEVEQFGGPWYKVGGLKGKSFACYGAESEKTGPNEYQGVDGAAFNVTLMDQAALLEDPRFEKTHYIGQHGWVTMRWDDEPDWKEVRQLAESAYRKVAGKRLIERLDA